MITSSPKPPKLKALTNRRAFSYFLVFSLILIGGISAVLHFRQITDSALLELFNEKRSLLESAVKKVKENGRFERIARDRITLYNFSRKDAPQYQDLPDSVLQDYRKLLGATNVKEINIWNQGAIMFYVTKGPFKAKGIAYWPIKTRPDNRYGAITSDLDQGYTASNVYLRPIDDEWCLFLYIYP